MRELLAALWLGLTITALVAPELAGKWAAAAYAGFFTAMLS